MTDVEKYSIFINNSKRPTYLITHNALYIIPKYSKVNYRFNEYGRFLVLHNVTQITLNKIARNSNFIKTDTNVVISEREIVMCDSLSSKKLDKILVGKKKGD